ncbi:haloacid dehalogenase [Candidatus Tenderia electrophaga]|jgi:enolase-phosphatase E1|uniref:Enolase-phosphatase E1 n=1 Tax=Candidatus Tenderia electrophaga TaxID=1748243 RepID=A0A0S2TD54_9GAMM|nr:haloacid dehalogenase [Candidatus Tenderia electrophaga]
MIKAVVTDIEGTTSSLSFVKDVLFPYAREHMAEFVRRHAHEPEVKAQLEEVRHAVGKDLDLDGIIRRLVQWIEEDQKITPLKTLQGMIWEAGYRDGAFTGHVYADAADRLRQWHAQGIRLYAFSSGSVRAQQLIFGYSDYGDLTPLFDGYFDTRIGAKREVEAYRHIIGAIGCAAPEILFLSDIVEELQASKLAGMQAVQVRRAGQTPWPGCIQAADFSEIDLAKL